MKKLVQSGLAVLIGAMMLGTSACGVLGPKQASEPSASSKDSSGQAAEDLTDEDVDGDAEDLDEDTDEAGLEDEDFGDAGDAGPADGDGDEEPDVDSGTGSAPVDQKALQRAKDAGAWKGAGQGRPSAAKNGLDLQSSTSLYGDPQFAFISPAETITCVFNDLEGGIGVCDNDNHSKTGHDADAWVYFFPSDGGQPISALNSLDGPQTNVHDVQQYKLTYGQTVYVANNVCHVENNGLTCWNSETGHGAFMQYRKGAWTW